MLGPKIMRILIALAFLLAVSNTARADLILTANDATIGRAGPAGLAGSYFHEGIGTTNYSVARTIDLMRSSDTTGTFVSTSINYSGNDSSSITSFLGADRSSYRGVAAASYDLSDAILHLTGYYYASAAGAVQFALSHDDSVQLTLAGRTVISSNIGNDTSSVTFTAPGYYAVDLIYSNTNYYNVGGANLNLTANGQTVTSANLVQSVVPEPATLALLGIALLGGAMLSRRLKS